MQWSGLWQCPRLQKALGDDFGVLPWPKAQRLGQGLGAVRRVRSMVNAKSQKINDAKAYVKWLWVERTDFQSELRPQLRLSTSRPARASPPRPTGCAPVSPPTR